MIIENIIDFKSKGKYMDNVDIIKLYRVIYMLYKIVSNFFIYCVWFLKLDWLVSWYLEDSIIILGRLFWKYIYCLCYLIWLLIVLDEKYLFCLWYVWFEKLWYLKKKN